MSRKSYSAKAARFVVRNPDEGASDAQVKSCNWLLRSRSHSVEFGNEAVDTLANEPTRADADSIIKHLSKCPPIRRQTKAQVVQTTDAVIAQMARDGKLGKIAQRKALAI